MTNRPVCRRTFMEQSLLGAAVACLALSVSVFERTPLGEQVFARMCAACHQADGAGVPGLYPSLRGNPVVLNPDATEQIRTVLSGLHGKEIGGESYASEMPAFGDQLDDPRVAAVINHTRTSWGNRAATITAAEVAKVRAGAQ